MSLDTLLKVEDWIFILAGMPHTPTLSPDTEKKSEGEGNLTSGHLTPGPTPTLVPSALFGPLCCHVFEQNPLSVLKPLLGARNATKIQAPLGPQEPLWSSYLDLNGWGSFLEVRMRRAGGFRWGRKGEVKSL